jgi:hypothetical protein
MSYSFVTGIGKRQISGGVYHSFCRTDMLSVQTVHYIADEIIDFKKSLLRLRSSRRVLTLSSIHRDTENIHVLGHVSQESINFS